jgi:hypothetical protein
MSASKKRPNQKRNKERKAELAEWNPKFLTACATNDLADVIKIIEEHGLTSGDEVDGRRGEMLVECCEKGYVNVVAKLLTVLSSGFTCLMVPKGFHAACKNGHLPVAKFMKNHLPEDVWLYVKSMRAAAIRGHLDIVNWMFNSCIMAPAAWKRHLIQGDTYFAWALVNRGHLAVLKCIADRVLTDSDIEYSLYE